MSIFARLLKKRELVLQKNKQNKINELYIYLALNDSSIFDSGAIAGGEEGFIITETTRALLENVC